MNKNTAFLPWWVWVVLVIEIVVPVAFASLAIVNTSQMFPGVEQVTPEISLYVVRNYVIALGIIIAICLRSYTAILLTVIMRMVMDALDMISSFLIGANEDIQQTIPFFVVILIIIPAFALVHLWKWSKMERQR